MTQKEKDELLQILSAMLPWRVKIDCFSVPRTLESIAIDRDGFITIDCGGDHFYHPFSNKLHKGCLPYLRPMESMTEEEEARRCAFLDDIEGGIYNAIPNYIDYLNSIHIDYRGLIKKGLALEAPEGMYN